MLNKTLIATVIASGVCALLAQGPNLPSVFTATQAEAGRKAFQDKGGTSGNKDAACAYCHTVTLTGRTGALDEIPALGSLEPAMQKAIQSSGEIPPLAGRKFIAVWGARTTQDLTNRIKLAAGANEPEETSVNLTAYILQVNGAKPGAQTLTAATAVAILDATTGIAPLTTTSPKPDPGQH
jgi:cytochrome c553